MAGIASSTPPLADVGIAGVSIGLAAQGFRPVAEIQFAGFTAACCAPVADITIVSWGAMITEASAAAEKLSEEGIEAEVIDVVTLKPFDGATILDSVRRTGRLVIVQEVPLTAGFSAPRTTKRICARAQRRDHPSFSLYNHGAAAFAGLPARQCLLPSAILEQQADPGRPGTVHLLRCCGHRCTSADAWCRSRRAGTN